MSGPKLLEKRVVTADVAEQKKQLIDSGIIMAQKVDAVRETLQSEEQKLELFRIETVKRVQIEIDALIRQKDALRDTLKDAERELSLKRIPLDAEWEKVNNAQKICNNWENELLGREEYINQQQAILKDKEKDIETESHRIGGLKNQATQLTIEAEEILQRAKEESASTRNEAQAILMSAELLEIESLKKEEQLITREEIVATKEKDIEACEQEIIKDKRVLADRTATLERTLKRLGK